VIGYWTGAEQAGYHFDLAKAKSLMQEAGYTYGSDGMLISPDGTPFKLTLYAPATETKSTPVLQQMWKALGVDVQIQLEEVGVEIPQLMSGDFELALLGYGGGADMLWYLFTSTQAGKGEGSSGFNLGHVKDPEMDKLTNGMNDAKTQEEFLSFAAQVQQRVIEQAYCIPLYTPATFTAVSNRIKGVKFTEIGGGTPIFSDAYIPEK
jgi:peptide/nickel transport system substrate-binding protein